MKKEILEYPGMRSYGIKYTKQSEATFIIPVVDVRDGKDQREVVNKSIKECNRRKGSRYITPTFTTVLGYSYNDSMKNTKKQ